MKRKYRLRFACGILFVVIGVSIGLFEFFVTRALANHSLWYLDHFFGPNHPTEYTYDQLYEYAADLTRHRNSQAYYYQSIICVLLIFSGVNLLLWSKDGRFRTGATSGSLTTPTGT